MAASLRRKPWVKYILYRTFLLVSFAAMHVLSSTARYVFYSGLTDMRKGFDSLSGIVTEQMQFNPLSMDVYVFINRRRTQIKLLQWEGDGFAFYYKRLEQGTYELPVAQDGQLHISITAEVLQNIFEGITIRRKYQRKRYQHNSENCG